MKLTWSFCVSALCFGLFGCITSMSAETVTLGRVAQAGGWSGSESVNTALTAAETACNSEITRLKDAVDSSRTTQNILTIVGGVFGAGAGATGGITALETFSSVERRNLGIAAGIIGLAGGIVITANNLSTANSTRNADRLRRINVDTAAVNQLRFEVERAYSQGDDNAATLEAQLLKMAIDLRTSCSSPP